MPIFSIEFFTELKNRFNKLTHETITTDQPIEETINQDNQAVVHSVESVADYDNQVKNAGNKVVVVEYYATKHEICRYIAPFLDTFAQKYASQIVVLTVAVDKQNELAKQYKLKYSYYRYLPTFVFLKNGQSVKRFSGSADPAKIENNIRALIN